MWYPGKAAFRTGSVDAEQWNDAKVGVASFAAGTNPAAGGESSVALGLGVTALGDASVALGEVSTASTELQSEVSAMITARSRVPVSRLLALTSGLVLATSCGGGDGPVGPQPPVVAVATVEVDPATASLPLDETLMLTAVAKDADGNVP